MASVTPVAGLATQVVTGNTPVTVIPPNPNGGFITNPASAADQGVALEPLYINPIGLATLNGNGTTFSLAPGQTWMIIPGQATATTVNAATSGHNFSAVYW